MEDKLFEIYRTHGIWIWAQPKTRETDNSVCWIANGRYVPTKRSKGLEVDAISYKECATPNDAYEHAINYLISSIKND
jgi:hypothetical protein